jgi:hypothetical protein
MFVKIRCFKTESEVTRFISVACSGVELVAKTEVTAISYDESPQEIIFQLDKPVGIHEIVVSAPDHDTVGLGAVVVGRIYVSNDGEIWYDLRLNGPNSDGQKFFRDNNEPGSRSPRYITTLWYGNSKSFHIEIPEAFFPDPNVLDARDRDSYRYQHTDVESSLAFLLTEADNADRSVSWRESCRRAAQPLLDNRDVFI